jgi:DNA-binding NarL/FixJ family response regulator
MRILLVQAHEAVRLGVREMLRALPFVEVVASVASMEAAANLINQGEQTPNVIIVSADIGAADLRLGTESKASEPKLLVLLPDAGPGHLTAAAQLPASGFLLQAELTADTLSAALVEISHGGMPMSDTLIKELLARAGSGRTGAPQQLSARELQVLGLVSDGWTNRQVARRLDVSEHSVKRCMANILAKLNCANRTAAVARAVADGFLAPVNSGSQAARL